MVAPSTARATRGKAHRGPRSRSERTTRCASDALLRLNGGNKWQTSVGHCYQRAAASRFPRNSPSASSKGWTTASQGRNRAVPPRRRRNCLVNADLSITHLVTREFCRTRYLRSRDPVARGRARD